MRVPAEEEEGKAELDEMVAELEETTGVLDGLVTAQEGTNDVLDGTAGVPEEMIAVLDGTKTAWEETLVELEERATAAPWGRQCDHSQLGMVRRIRRERVPWGSRRSLGSQGSQKTVDTKHQ